ncbi:MAG: NAD(P)H-dependent oxidoreductase subunit E [Chromatiales bacterium]|nr:NAD(P)H-dependent oxidoreductase subunit E [Chromatiales bacterium]
MSEPDSKRRRVRFRPKGHQASSHSLQAVEALIGPPPYQRDLLIEYLHRLQDHFHYLGNSHLVALAELLRLAPVEVFEVASFYHHFDLAAQGDPPSSGITVRVCESISCELAGARELMVALRSVLGESVRIQPVPCVGQCDGAPVAVVGTNPVRRADALRVRMAITEGRLQAPVPAARELSRYHCNCGYKTLHAVNERWTMEDIICTIENAGLRGLGGAGFPAGRKWRSVRDREGPRYLVVNVDEGEPGTFKDRHYLENDPHACLEGILIAAKVIEAEAIYIYLRDEYAACRTILEEELPALQANPPCPIPPIHLRRGAGAYICGEESALIESIEGKRGMPRLRPPFVAERGLFGRPTLEHNLETLYWVPEILRSGAQWYQAQGRHGRKGLRTFSVSGRVNKPGVHLAPAGITARELIDEYCGGMLAGHELKAYFPGGASGGILPAKLADIPLDFDTLSEYGCFIGSAAIIVLSAQDNVALAALNAMCFFAHESCGQCTPCRVGTVRAADLMSQARWNATLLEDLAAVMQDASICGLGQAAPNVLRCALRWFPEDCGL